MLETLLEGVACEFGKQLMAENINRRNPFMARSLLKGVEINQ